MSTRLASFGTHWKAITGVLMGVTAGLMAFIAEFDKLEKAIEAFAGLPPLAHWIAAGILAAIVLVVLLATLSKRSKLRRPERFLLSKDNPAHLGGRGQHIAALARDCEQRALVFLTGESGAGKSSLVKAGIVPHFRSGYEGVPPLLPVLIELSAVSWDAGLRKELAREIGQLADSERQALGLATDLSSDGIFSALQAVPDHAPQQLLVILDQFDDHVAAHREHFFRDHTVVPVAEIEEASRDWGALGKLVRSGKVHVLVVARDDIGACLESVRFTTPVSYHLPRLEPRLLGPLLGSITAPDADGEVVHAPEHGWHQLQERLLRDLAAGNGQVLPVQLAIALDALRRMDTLTVGEYNRHGGARGLERLPIERHVKEAAAAGRLTEQALLGGLLSLVHESGTKTVAQEWSAFEKAVHAPEFKPTVDHLERWHIVRRTSVDGKDMVVLHHDYLARGVREAHRHANRWRIYVHERSVERGDATGLWARWRALLPLRVQPRLAWERLRGRFAYGPYRGFALWSMLRLLPLLVVLAGLKLGAWSIDRLRDEQLAERLLAGVAHGEDMDKEEEAGLWLQLAGASEHARLHFLQQALSNPKSARRVGRRVDVLAHALVQLDPSGKRSQRMFDEVVGPVLRSWTQSCPDKDDPIAHLAWMVAPRLRLGTSERAAFLEILVRCPQSFRVVSRSLATWAARMDPNEVQRTVAALVKQMEGETPDHPLARYKPELSTLAAKLDRDQATRLAEPLVRQMENNRLALSSQDSDLHWRPWWRSWKTPKCSVPLKRCSRAWNTNRTAVCLRASELHSRPW